MKHLKEHHQLFDPSRILTLVGSQRIGQKSQVHYWCGFCNKIMKMKQKGPAGDDERFNHIDNHFTKDKFKIEQWKPLEGRPSARDVSAEAEHTGSDSGTSDDSIEREGDEDDDADASAQLPQSAPAGQTPRKRPAPTTFEDDYGPSPKAPRHTAATASRGRSQTIYCCNCSNPSVAAYGVCAPCNHQHCLNCRRG